MKLIHVESPRLFTCHGHILSYRSWWQKLCSVVWWICSKVVLHIYSNKRFLRWEGSSVTLLIWRKCAYSSRDTDANTTAPLTEKHNGLPYNQLRKHGECCFDRGSKHCAFVLLFSLMLLDLTYCQVSLSHTLLEWSSWPHVLNIGKIKYERNPSLGI